MSRRVVITGIGLVTPLGVGGENIFERVIRGESGIREIESFDTTGFPCHLGAPVRDFSAREHIQVRNLRKMDANSAMAVAACRLALDNAGLKITPENNSRVGIMLGVSYGCTDLSVKLNDTIRTKGPRQANPIIVPNVVMNAPAGHASIELGIKGINTTVNHYGSSAETAIAYGVEEIRRGRADAVLAGGADVLGAFYYEVLIRFKALSGADGGKEAARPFDRRANGFVVGEGAGVVCLEALESAENRGAKPISEVLGWGMSSSPCTPTDWTEDPKGPVLAVARALNDAGLGPEDIDFICASANGNSRLDALEAGTITGIFGEGSGVLVSSFKGALGESFSSGGIRTALTALTLRDGIAAPTLGLEDPINGLNFVKDNKRITVLRQGMVHGFSSGGANTVLVMGKP